MWLPGPRGSNISAQGQSRFLQIGEQGLLRGQELTPTCSWLGSQSPGSRSGSGAVPVCGPRLGRCRPGLRAQEASSAAARALARSALRTGELVDGEAI